MNSLRAESECSRVTCERCGATFWGLFIEELRMRYLSNATVADASSLTSNMARKAGWEVKRHPLCPDCQISPAPVALPAPRRAPRPRTGSRTDPRGPVGSPASPPSPGRSSSCPRTARDDWLVADHPTDWAARCIRWSAAAASREDTRAGCATVLAWIAAVMLGGLTVWRMLG